MGTREFKVPLARMACGALIRPADAAKDVVYLCPACPATLILRAGEKNARHFAHRPSSSCSSESVKHKLAKLLIVEAVENWKIRGAPVPAIERACDRCGARGAQRQPFPARVERAALEHTVQSGRVVDVALLAGDELLCGVEVCESNAVSADKAEDLGDLRWFEVTADAVLADALLYRPSQHNLSPCMCEACKRQLQLEAQRAVQWGREEQRRQAEAAQHARLREALVRALPFKLEEFAAYAVNGVDRCPNGHDVLRFGWANDWFAPPPDPRPPRLLFAERRYRAQDEFRTGRTVSRIEWSPVCLECGLPVAQRSQSVRSGRRNNF